MQLKLLLLFFVMLITAGLNPQEVQVTMENEIQYRLLNSCKPRGPLPTVDCAITVDSFLNRKQIESLICQVVRKERPFSASVLTITIYYKLDEVFATGISPILEKKLNDYIIANYSWNKGIPGMQKRLWIRRDTQGAYVSPPEGLEFDHTKACDHIQ
jgi:hypothetical protein